MRPGQPDPDVRFIEAVAAFERVAECFVQVVEGVRRILHELGIPATARQQRLDQHIAFLDAPCKVERRVVMNTGRGLISGVGVEIAEDAVTFA